MSRDDAGMPRRRRSPRDLRRAVEGELGVEEQLDRAAAQTLDRLLQPVVGELSIPHECFVPGCTDVLSQADLAHDVGSSEDTISRVLSGQDWPNLQLLLALLTSL